MSSSTDSLRKILGNKENLSNVLKGAKMAGTVLSFGAMSGLSPLVKQLNDRKKKKLQDEQRKRRRRRLLF